MAKRKESRGGKDTYALRFKFTRSRSKVTTGSPVCTMYVDDVEVANITGPGLPGTDDAKWLQWITWLTWLRLEFASHLPSVGATRGMPLDVDSAERFVVELTRELGYSSTLVMSEPEMCIYLLQRRE